MHSRLGFSRMICIYNHITILISPVLSRLCSHKVCSPFYEPFTSSCMPHSSSMVTQASMGKAISLPLRFRCSSRDLPNDGFSTHASATQNSNSSSSSGGCNQTRTDVRLHSSAALPHGGLSQISNIRKDDLRLRR